LRPIELGLTGMRYSWQDPSVRFRLDIYPDVEEARVNSRIPRTVANAIILSNEREMGTDEK
jgi:hypothetical protein